MGDGVGLVIWTLQALEACSSAHQGLGFPGWRIQDEILGFLGVDLGQNMIQKNEAG
jgi:hypothetical protein